MVISEYVVQVDLSLAMREFSVLKFFGNFFLGLPPADLGGSDELANLENGRGLLHLCPHTSGQSQMHHHLGLIHQINCFREPSD